MKTHRNCRPPSGWSSFTLALLLLIAGAVTDTALGQPAGYRDWVSTTFPEPVPIARQYPSDFPVGVYFYTYYHPEMEEIWDYVGGMGADYILYTAEKGNYIYPRWPQYKTLIDSAPAGKRVVPWVGYVGYGNRPSYLDQGSSSREALFYFYDTSELRALRYFTDVFTVFSWDDNVFTYLAEPDSIRINPDPEYELNNQAPREAIYTINGGATNPIASGIAFGWDSTQSERWNQTWNGSSWQQTAHPINSSQLFEGIDWAKPDPDNPGQYTWQKWRTFRSPHYIVVRGHLFEGGEALDSDTLLLINVYYEVDKGKTYRDSTNFSDTMQVADTNLRFLYKQLAVTKADLKPTGPPFNWDLYQEAAKKINFRREGMGGPTDTNVTAISFDVEVIYTGVEDVALRSLSIRDSIAHVLQAPEGTGFRAALLREIDTLTMKLPDSTLYPAVHSPNVSDEPPPLSSIPFRVIQERIEENPLYGYAPNDTMTAMHGAAVPYLQWAGHANHTLNGSYIGRAFYDIGDKFRFNTITGGDTVFAMADIPSAKQHGGGRWGIPHFFDFDSMSVSGYAEILKGRIDTMELFWQHGRLGAAIPGQLDVDERFSHQWKIAGMHECARLARLTGRSYFANIGLQSFFRLRWNAAQERYDTGMDHRFERTEVRSIVRTAPIAYGAIGLGFYAFEASTWVRKDNDSLAKLDPSPARDTNHLVNATDNGDRELGFGGQHLNDTLYNILDYPLRSLSSYHVDNGVFIRDTLDTLENLYMGYRNTYRELQQSLAWLKGVGPTLKRLKWRDAYSVHWGANVPDSPYDDDTNVVKHRSLPSDEIVTNVKTWHPITGEVDSLWETYVELGFYETMIDTTGGVRNRLLDTNYVGICQRRVFSVENYDSADIGYSAATKAILDTLTETRVIELTMKLLTPDTSNQFNRFVRVQEVFPDTSHLPLLGKRKGLDSTVATLADGTFKVRLVLGPGQAALLRCTYAQPDESVDFGILTHSNQKKILYSDNYYYCTYHRYDSASQDYHVYLRRSLPAGSTGAILWEPIEHKISGALNDKDTARTDNRHPSMTLRTVAEDTVVSITWSAHPANGPAGTREILLRDFVFTWQGDIFIGIPVTEQYAATIRSVAFYKGLDPDQWGTPVICSSSDDSHRDTAIGEYIAWSDSTVGIVTRGRLRSSVDLWWILVPPYGPQWTPPDSTLNGYYAYSGYDPGQYPSMPAFTHRGMNQVDCPIVWQQPDSGSYIGITYHRLDYIPPPTGPAIQVNFLYNSIWITPETGPNPPLQFVHPSIDQSQDGLGRVMEGVVCEWSYFVPGGGWDPDTWKTNIFFQSLFYDTSASEAMTVGGMRVYVEDEIPTYPPDHYCYPVVSSENQVMQPADSNLQPLFAVAYERPTDDNALRLLEAKWLTGMTAQWKQTPPRQYDYAGRRPNGASSTERLEARYAALYSLPSDSVLRTTRQYFARTRPGGYQAEGREIGVRLGDSTGFGFGARLYDVWMSDAQQSRPLELVEFTQPDSLSDLFGLLRSECFTTSDSVDIGWTAHGGIFAFDTTDLNDRETDCLIELVDSATGEVVQVLDSVRLSALSRHRYRKMNRTVDLLSGTYYVQMRLVSEELEQNRALDTNSRLSVSHINGWIDGIAAKRVRKLDGEGGSGLRVSAQPNPFTGETEIRFSISRKEHVTLGVYDALGRKVGSLVEQELYEPGRYAVGFDGRGLKPGTYIVELQTLNGRVTEKVVVRR